MIAFLKKNVFISIGFIVLLASLHIVNDLYFNFNKPNDSVFIWGDSQMLFGLDLIELKNVTHKKNISAAKHGNGVYDFLVFVNKIPAKSKVFIQVSKGSQWKTKDIDNNHSGVSFSSLVLLKENNYSWPDLYHILKVNVLPSKLFENKFPLFPYSDSIVYIESIKGFRNAFNNPTAYIGDKQALFLEGIQILKNKNCRISFVEFPYHPILQKIESNAAINIHLQRFRNELINDPSTLAVDTIQLDTTIQIMHDLTHFNERGAFLLAQKLNNLKFTSEKSHYYYIQWR